MILNEAGRTIQRVWEDLPQRFPTIVLDVFQLMPNHLHGILVIPQVPGWNIRWHWPPAPHHPTGSESYRYGKPYPYGGTMRLVHLVFGGPKSLRSIVVRA
jgi:hypothetical protein